LDAIPELTTAQKLAAVKTLAPRKGKRGTVSPAVWQAWCDARAALAFWQDQVDECEVLLREELGDAAVIVVGGQVAGWRQKFSQRIRPPYIWLKDYIQPARLSSTGDTAGATGES
jgi:hypothetical protein